jgi:CXXX repeat peptide maturase
LGNWTDDDITKYENELKAIIELIRLPSNEPNLLPEINILTDIFDLTSMANCEAGKKSYSLAPNGKLYLCPAFYFENPENSIGDLDEGLNIKNHDLMQLSKAPICDVCDAYHCQRCIYLNKKLTGEYNIPSKLQCVVSHIERRCSLDLQKVLKEAGMVFENNLKPIDYLDPLTKICEVEKNSCL